MTLRHVGFTAVPPGAKPGFDHADTYLDPRGSRLYVAYTGADRIDVFARGVDGALWHLWYGPDGWQPWESLDARVTSDPAASSWGRDRIDVFARGSDGDLLHAAWDGRRWSFAME